MDISQYIDTAVTMAINYAPKVLLALVTYLVGIRLIKVTVKLVDKGMKRKKMDESLRNFLESLIAIALKVLLIVTVAGMVGIETTSFIAILGAAGLAVGLALQGSLANFAGGVLVLMFRPYKIGDLIEAQGFTGIVKKIEIFNTIMVTLDNKTIIIPNGQMSNGAITNYSKEPLRRVDMTFGIGYDDDLKKAQKLFEKIVNNHKKILKDPAPQVRVSELGDSSVNFVVRPWAKTEDYWDVYFDITEQIKLECDKAKISIPYPQMDIHMKK